MSQITAQDVADVIAQTGLPQEDLLKYLRFLLDMKKEGNAEAQAAATAQLRQAAQAAKSTGKERDQEIQLLKMLVSIYVPETSDEMAEAARRDLATSQTENSRLLSKLAGDRDFTDAEYKRLFSASQADVSSYFESVFAEGSDTTIPIKGRRAYQIFGGLTGDDDVVSAFDDFVADEKTTDLGELFYRDEPSAVDAAQAAAEEWLASKQGQGVIKDIAGSSHVFSTRKDELTKTLQKQLAETLLLDSRREHLKEQQGRLEAREAALSSEDPDQLAPIFTEVKERGLDKAIKEFPKLTKLLGLGAEPTQEKIADVAAASVIAGGDSDAFLKLMSNMSPAERQLYMSGRGMDPISAAALRFDDNRRAATEDPSFMLWREKTGSTGQGTPNYNEYMRYNRQAMRAQAGGVLGPAVPRTGDVRLIAYTDTRGAYETDDAGTVYFYNEDSGLPESPEAVGRVADKAVEGADVVTFELDAVDGLRNKLGVAVVEVVGEATEDALREGGSRVYYDRKRGDFVVLDKDRKVIAKDLVVGPRADRLQELAGDSSFADVLGDLAGLQRGESGNSAKSGSLADLEVGKQDNAHGTFVPKGTLYTTKAPVRYVAGEVVYRKGQSAGVLNILDAGEKGRGDNRVRQISTQDVIFTSAEGRDGFKKARADLEKMLNERVKSGALKPDDRSRVLEDLTIPDEEMERAFRRPLRQRVSDFVRGDARRARTEMRETTLPFTPSEKSGTMFVPEQPLTVRQEPDSSQTPISLPRNERGSVVFPETKISVRRPPAEDSQQDTAKDLKPTDPPKEDSVSLQREGKGSMAPAPKGKRSRSGSVLARALASSPVTETTEDAILRASKDTTRKSPETQTDGTDASLTDFSAPLKSLTSPTPLVTDAPQTTPVADAAPSEDTGALEPVSEEDEERARKRMEALRSQAAEVEEAERRAAAQQVP